MRAHEFAFERRRRKPKTAYGGFYGYYWGDNDAGADGGGDGGESIHEGLGSKALVAALVSALATGPAQAEPSTAAQALGIIRTINKFKNYDSQDLHAEAQLELNNILRAIQGHPNQSRLYPIIKNMAQDPAPIDTESLPPLTNEPINEIEAFLQECEQGSWIIVEQNENVQVVKSELLDQTLSNKPNVIKKLQDFINFKQANPTQPFGASDTQFVGNAPMAKAVPKLKHAHLSQDHSVYYTIEGRNPTVIKIFGVFSHTESGMGHSPNIRKQKNLANLIKNQI